MTAATGRHRRTSGHPRRRHRFSGVQRAHLPKLIQLFAELIGSGQVRHTRLRPSCHAFNYANYFLMLSMRSMALHGSGSLARNRSAALSFFDSDHGDSRANALEWLDEVLLRERVEDADGEVWLHTCPRVLGYTFKPVSFWYCHQADGSLRAIVVEVHNTFGERCHLLGSP